MPQGTRICKICGREYPYCKTNRPADIFRWQDVACSPDHAAIYFSEIAESRSHSADYQASKSSAAEDSAEVLELIDDTDEEDEFSEEEFVDDDELEIE